MQRTPDRVEVALGIGMSGRNHWSIAFTPSHGPRYRTVDNWLAFGLACRLRENVLEVRSSYRLVPPVQVTRIGQRSIEMAGPDVQLHVHSEERLIGTDGGFAIVVETDPAQQLPYTRKWSYDIVGEAADQT